MNDTTHTPGPWTICNMVHAERGGPMTPSEIGEYVANSVRKTHGESGLNHFLFIDGGDKDVCLIGNGLQGQANAELIVQAWKIPDLDTKIASLTAENERLREALINIQIEYKREGSRFPHLQRVVAINCRAALQLKEGVG